MRVKNDRLLRAVRGRRGMGRVRRMRGRVRLAMCRRREGSQRQHQSQEQRKAHFEGSIESHVFKGKTYH